MHTISYTYPSMPFEYCCPRCALTTYHKTGMQKHLFNKKKNCQPKASNIVLTQEIKEGILNRTYRSNKGFECQENDACISKDATTTVVNTVKNVVTNRTFNIQINMYNLPWVSMHSMQPLVGVAAATQPLVTFIQFYSYSPGENAPSEKQGHEAFLAGGHANISKYKHRRLSGSGSSHSDSEMCKYIYYMKVPREDGVRVVNESDFVPDILFDKNLQNVIFIDNSKLFSFF